MRPARALAGAARGFTAALFEWSSQPAALLLQGLFCVGSLRFVQNTPLPWPQAAALGLLLAGLSGLGFVLVGLLLRLTPYAASADVVLSRVSFASRNWRAHALRSALELGAWLQVIWGSYSLTGSLWAASLAGTASGVVLALLGEALVESVRSLERALHARHRRAVSASGSGEPRTMTMTLYLLLAYVGMSALAHIFARAGGVGVAVLLATFAGVVFVCAAELLNRWETTRAAGRVLVRRVTDWRRLWRVHPLRSCVELLCSGGIAVGAFAAGRCSLAAAIALGAASGVVLSLFGELAHQRFAGDCCCAEAPPPPPEAAPALSRNQGSKSGEHDLLLPGLTLLGYVGASLLASIYEQVADPEIALMLATLTGVALVVASEAIVAVPPLRLASHILHGRFANAAYNWSHHFLRSFVEVGCWLGISAATLRATGGDVVYAVQQGTLAGAIITLAGEFFVSRMAVKDSSPRAPSLLFAYACAFGYVALALFRVISSAQVDLRLAFVLATAAGCAFVCSSEMLMLWPPTRTAGELLQRRFTHAGTLWRTHTFRSAVELGTFLVVVYGSVALGADPLTAVQLGTVSSIVVVFGSSLGRGLPLAPPPTPPAPEEDDDLPPLSSITPHAGPRPRARRRRDPPTPPPMPRRGSGPQGQGAAFAKAALGYVCVLSFRAIYKHVTNTEIAFLLATLASAAVVAADGSQNVRVGAALLRSRFTHIRHNWRTQTLRSFVETGCWLGVCYGTYAIYDDIVTAVHVGTASGALVALAGEVIAYLMRTDPGHTAPAFHFRGAGLVIPLFFLSANFFNTIYENIENIQLACLLATLTGISFICVSELLAAWPPTRASAAELQTRFSDIGGNWRARPLRSFVETGCWLGTIFGAYATYGDVFTAVQLGTVSGIAVVLLGDLAVRSASPRATIQGREAVALVVGLIGYVGVVTFNLIFGSVQHLLVAVLISTVAGVAFLVAGDLLVRVELTRSAGRALQNRVLEAQHNWAAHPMRSAVELGSGLGVLYLTFARYKDIVTATQIGTASGIFVILVGEAVSRRLPGYAQLPAGGAVQHDVQILPLPAAGLFAFVVVWSLDVIYRHIDDLVVAAVLATAACVAFAVAGDVFMAWRPTRHAGYVLQDRVLCVRRNWARYPLRSAVELGVWLSVIYGTYYMLQLDPVRALAWGTLAGVTVTLLGEFCVNDMRTVSAALEKSRQRSSAAPPGGEDEEAAILRLPQELLVEVAHCLRPEEVLNCRLVCHTVNDVTLLQAGLWWRYVKRAPAVAAARSTVVGAAATLRSFWRAKHTVSLLKQGGNRNAALRWVYLNASWIRAQGMPRMGPRRRSASAASGGRLPGGGGPSVRLEPGHPGFEVFRNMPSHECFGIRRAGAALEVPAGLYSDLQKDPLTFLAAHSLKHSHPFYHACVVVLFVLALVALSSLQVAGILWLNEVLSGGAVGIVPDM